MSIQKTVFLFLSLLLLFSCNQGKTLAIPEINADFIEDAKIDLSGAVFFLGPEIDHEQREIIADCDCCASDLAFLNDSSFIYVERCMGGDGYVKGFYFAFNGRVFLHIDGNTVSSEEDMLSEKISYTTNKQKDSYLTYEIFNTTGKMLLCYKDGEYSEFGLKSKRVTLDDFLDEFRKEKVLRTFLEEK